MWWQVGSLVSILCEQAEVGSVVKVAQADSDGMQRDSNAQSSGRGRQNRGVKVAAADSDGGRRGIRTPSLPIWSEILAQHHLSRDETAGRSNPSCDSSSFYESYESLLRQLLLLWIL